MVNTTASTATLFNGLTFFIDGFPVKAKLHLSDEIKKGGGSSSYLLTKKTSVCVVPNLDNNNSYNVDQCTKVGIPIVTDDFIFNSIESGRLRLEAVRSNKDILLKTLSEIQSKSTPTPSTSTTPKSSTFISTSLSTLTSTKPSTSSAAPIKKTTISSKPSTTTSSTLSNPTKPVRTSTTKTTSFANLTTISGQKKSESPKTTVTNSYSGKLTNGNDKREDEPPRSYKSSYFKQPGKYLSKSNSTPKAASNSQTLPEPDLFADLPQATGYDEEEDEIDMFSIFDDVFTPSKPTNSVATNKQPNIAPTIAVTKDEEDDDDAAFASLFDDFDYLPATSATLTTPVPTSKQEEPAGLPYPFFKLRQREAVLPEATPIEEDTKATKPRALRKDAYLCKLKNLPKYVPTIDDDGNSLISITGMKEHSDFSFEELRMLQSVSSNFTEERSISIPELAPGGDMWIWGWPKFGQLGRGGKLCSRSALPTHTPLPHSYSWHSESLSGKVKQIACGWGHTVCLTESGAVASWGKGRGRLGHEDHCSKRLPTFISAFSNVTIAYVACGSTHTAFVSNKGQLWTVGDASSGQLGHGNFENTLIPKLVESLVWNPIAMVSCGANNTAAITQKGHLYTWGSNDSGQLGYDVEGECHATPALVSELKNEVICHIALGEKHMAAVSADGSVWTWGSNYYKQLGHDGWHSATPRKLSWSYGKKRLGKAFMVACGESHTVAVLVKEATTGSETIVLTWGRGNMGALGNGSLPISVMEPINVEALKNHKVTQVSCGAHHTAALTSRGLLWIWGDNSRDQGVLGRELSPTPYAVGQLSHVTHVACGGYHTSVLVSGYDSRMIQHAQDGNYQQVEDLLAFEPLLMKCTDASFGFTPLHWACHNGHSEIVELLVRHGSDINAVTKSGLAPLHVCAYRSRSVSCLQILTRTANIKLDLPSVTGETPLHIAVNHQNENAVDILVQAGCDKRAVDSQGNTALHLAIILKNHRIARYLVRHAAPITIHDSKGKTPLHYCTNDSINRELKQIAQNHDVFISYAHSDMAFARKVRMELERNCIKCWMDDQRLEAGSDWRADIGKGILAARLIVFLGSPTSIVSDWCLKELRMGEKNSKLIWPVWYQKVEVPTSVSVLFSTSKYIDLSTDELYHTGIPTLVHKLKHTIDKLDRYEIPETHSRLRRMDFQVIASKPFSYLAYLPSDTFIATTLKHMLGSNGVLCVDESMLPVVEEEPVPTDPDEAPTLDVNVGFWAEEKKKEELLLGDILEEVEAKGNEGIRLCNAFILVVSKELVDRKDNQIRKHIKFAQENHKPIVLIIKDLPQQFKFSEDDKYYEGLSKCPSFQFATRELQFLSSEDVLENLKRVVYVVELLYKESLLAAKLRQIDLEKARMLAEAQRLAEEEAKKRKKFSKV